MVDERTRKVIEHGRRIRAVLAQPQFEPLALGEQVALLLAVAERLLDDVPLDRVVAFRKGLGAWLAQHCPELLALDEQAPPLTGDLRASLKAAMQALVCSIMRATGEALPGVDGQS
jgi:F0F1-type ATP synthase alpha subunit